MLCDVCLRIISDELYGRSRTVGSDDEVQFGEESAVTSVTHRSVYKEEQRLQDCYLCSRLGRPIEDESIRLEFDGSAHLPEKHLTLALSSPTVRGDTTTTRFFVQPAYKPAYDLARKARQSQSTGSQESLDLAAHWMKTCLQKHTKCNSRGNTKWYPTRLLDISGEEVRLIKTSEHEPEGPYATLSHCWGDEAFLVLTQENMSQFEAGFSRRARALPLNFRHAITVACELGIRYIWIDCYCIIQDSASGDHADEKLVEIAQMTKVYANSILNIGATHGTSPSDGCFVKRKMHATLPECFFPLTATGERSEEMFHVYGDARSEISSLGRHHLFQRAWVLQERLLCPRMLHFGEEQLFWECLELVPALESFPCGQISADAPNLFAIDSEDLSQSKLLVWSRAVEDYTQMTLSFPTKDKFVAIGGIAELLAERTEDRYIAGFSRENLIPQLCWESRGSSTVTNEWRAPSWSWASVDGGVLFKPELMVSPVLQEMVALQEVDVKLTDPDNPFGLLTSASLVLKCRLIPMTIWREDLDTYLDDNLQNWAEPGNWTSFDRTYRTPRLPKDRSAARLDSRGIRIPMQMDNSSGEYDTSDQYILPLVLSFGSEQSRMTIEEAIANPLRLAHEGSIHCLLVKSVRASRGSFVRWGSADCRDIDSGPVLEEWVKVKEEIITLL